MKEYTKEEAVEQMNRWGQERQPFLFMIDYKQERIYADIPTRLSPTEILYDLNGFTNVEAFVQARQVAGGREIEKESGRPIEWNSFPMSLEEYAISFEKVKKHIYAGNSYLVNLTCSTPVKTDLTLQEIFYRSKAKYKVWMKDRFVVFSPEIFVRMSEGTIYSYPMKGTIDASIPEARRQIWEDPKETAEHATIVDLIRNDLSLIANRVTVSRFRYIDEIRTHKGPLLQVSSEVKGCLPDGWEKRIGTLLFHLLPAGSITGAPKKKTMQIIAEAETYQRGFYTGVMGYFDGRNLDSAVMIRFLEKTPEGLFFKSGGGITAQSELVSEYNEMKQKIYVPIY